jgi:hypothetical protein
MSPAPFPLLCPEASGREPQNSMLPRDDAMTAYPVGGAISRQKQSADRSARAFCEGILNCRKPRSSCPYLDTIATLPLCTRPPQGVAVDIPDGFSMVEATDTETNCIFWQLASLFVRLGSFRLA